MPSLIRQFLQLRLRAAERSPGCRRAVCRRFKRCVPPPDAVHDGLPRCPFMRRDESEDWKAELPDRLEPLDRLLAPHPHIREVLASDRAAELASTKSRPLTRRQRRRLPWHAR
jgi:hypothetical protein